jgi:glutamate---cysteine ligase / carboxylate-amine ligase
LLPSGMHPWMEPHRDMRLWPHEYNPVYEAFNRIFNCQGHGWANLQSVHLNLPFADDTEFAQLHAAIRLLLPILPALAASSPLVEGRLSGYLDTRLEVYRTNAQRVPSVTAQVIPEPVFTRHDYERDILARLYRDIAPYDPEAILQEEWLNARGAIARFDRHAIEIRVLDVQECPWADLAICAAIVAVLRAMLAEHWCSLAQQQAWPVEPLSAILLDVIRHADLAVLNHPQYLQAFGFPDGPRCTAGELWQYLLEASRVLETHPDWTQPLRTIVQHGPLARRVLRAVQDAPTRARIHTVYQALRHCLATGTVFVSCP